MTSWWFWRKLSARHPHTFVLNGLFQLTQACLPEALDGKLFADIAFGLVFGWFCRSHTVEHRQPHHRLGLQAHPLQEVRHLNGRFPWSLDKEGGRRRSTEDSKQPKYRPREGQVHKVMRREAVLPFQRWICSEKGIKENTNNTRVLHYGVYPLLLWKNYKTKLQQTYSKLCACVYTVLYACVSVHANSPSLPETPGWQLKKWDKREVNLIKEWLAKRWKSVMC